MSSQKTDAFLDLNSVVWERGSGRHGLYERAKNNSPAHERLLLALKERGNSCFVEEFHVWVFKNRIYRRVQETALE